MPLEIKELHIKVVVENEETTPSRPSGDSPPPDTQEIVALCVAQVMEILKEKSER